MIKTAALKNIMQKANLVVCLATGAISFSELHMYNSPDLCGLHSFMFYCLFILSY